MLKDLVLSCALAIATVFASVAWAPTWMLATLGCLGGAVILTLFVVTSRDNRQDKHQRSRDAAELQARIVAGEPTAPDVEHLIYRRWGPAGSTWWEEDNGLIPFSQGREVRLAVREQGPYRDGRQTHSPAVVCRWVLSSEDPSMLVQFVRAGITDAELDAYMNGTPEHRSEVEATAALMVALTPDG